MSGPFTSLLAADLDGTLVGDDTALGLLNGELARRRPSMAIAYVTGRNHVSAQRLIEEAGLLQPDALITCVGSYIYYAPDWGLDLTWHRRLTAGWSSERVRAVAALFPEIIVQPLDAQSVLKCSYHLAVEQAPHTLRALAAMLRGQRVNAKIVYSSDWELDLLPPQSGKGNAVRHLAASWGVPMGSVFTVGDSGNDLEMLSLDCLCAMVGNAREELRLGAPERVYRARAPYAEGVHEALRHFGWL